MKRVAMGSVLVAACILYVASAIVVPPVAWLGTPAIAGMLGVMAADNAKGGPTP